MREKIEPELKAYLEEQDALGGRPFEKMTPEENRVGEDETIQALQEGLTPADMKSVEDRDLDFGDHSVPVRIYTPKTGNKPFPVIVFFHGGGWVIGSVENRDFRCRTIADEIGAIVVSVDYRLAPEFPFPAAPEDCYAAALWAWRNCDSFDGDSNRLCVMGDSSGGNLSAVVALMARDKGEPAINRQILIYPVVDLVNMERESYKEFGEDHFLTKAAMEYFINYYIPEKEERTNPLASPLYMESFSNLPAAYIVTAECDVLRDEAETYAEKLKAAGVEVSYSCFSGLLHGFIEMSSVSGKVDKANREILDTIKSFLRS